MEIAALVISGISLLVSIIAFIRSARSQSLQDRVNKVEYKLKEYELNEKEQEQIKRPCIEARIIPISQGDFKIKVWNSGNAPAKNIMASWEQTGGVFLIDRNKMPFEFLDPQKSFDLRITTCDGVVSKLCITTSWEDEQGKKDSKTQWCDL